MYNSRIGNALFIKKKTNENMYLKNFFFEMGIRLHKKL